MTVTGKIQKFRIREIMTEELKLGPESIIRKKEPIFAESDLDEQPPEAWVKMIPKHPILLERPIVVHGDKAIIGRPPENVLTLLTEN